MSKSKIAYLVIPIAVSLITGCGSNAPDSSKTAPETQQPEKLEPVTLKMYQTQGYWTEDDFKKLIAEPVKKKYPHITVEFEPKTNIEQALTSGAPIDLVAVWNGIMPQYDDLRIFEDITPLVTKFKMDLGRFDPGSLDAIKKATASGKLYGLPTLVQFNALYYNKAIFDRFGVPYPKDGMTWEETIDLAKKVTRLDGGTQYIGLDPDYLTRQLTPMSLGILDVTNKPDVNSEPYKKVFELTKKIYEIEGNTPKEGIMKGSVTDRFIKQKNVAMLTTVNLLSSLKTDPELNWDIAQYPSFKERPNMFGTYDLHIMTISSLSTHKDDAMRVLDVMMSDEVQMLSSQMGRYTAMKDPKFNQNFVKDVPEFKGKNTQAIFKSKPAPATPPYSKYYSNARGILVEKFRAYAEGKKDVNTALREAQDEIEAYVKSQVK